jgi:hypothetical protein
MLSHICHHENRGYVAPSCLALLLARRQSPAMTDASTLDQTPAHRGDRRDRPAVTVAATQLGVHLGLTRQRICVLADVEHVLERAPDGRFDQDACRLAYLKWLRDPARRSARTQADAEFVKAKTEMLKLRLMEKKRDLVQMDEVNEMIDSMIGLVLTKLGGLPARVGGNDLVARRKAEAVVFEVRTELANEFQRRADECNEPDECRSMSR